LSRSSPIIRRRRRRALALGTLTASALALALTGTLPETGGTSPAAGQGALVEPTPQTDDSVPASDVTMIGATPAEAGAGANETWGVGQDSSRTVVVRYAAQNEHVAETGWMLGPGLQDEAGQPLAEFELDTLETAPAPSPLAGQMTPDGAGVLVGKVAGTQEVLLVRDPGNPSNPFRETKPAAETELEHGQHLFSFTRAPLIAPLDESEGHAGALVVPVTSGSSGGEESVLHWDGAKEEWSREKIELPSGVSGSEFHVLGIGASSPANAWLLGELSLDEVALFHRQLGGSEGPVWQAVALESPKSGGVPGEPITVDKERFTIPGARKRRIQTQVLTVTGEGVWIDGERPEVKASTTIFFKPAPEGEDYGSTTIWCTLESSPPGTEPCEHSLPERLPTGSSRSIAWATPGTEFGERVIAGLSEGVSLRLEGNQFKRVLALGGSPGAQFGAAFSSSREGWLGNFELPVHLTVNPEPSQLKPWPVPFRHALVAVAPQPEAPVGALSSEALAVGDDGEVARYQPGKGWLPESLFGANERLETPRLRAVAWPTPNRAYAVGDRNPQSGLGQMWLWRGETGLWEPDPATPYNFTGNLLGIAFEPSEPARGYAVGESGVLLSYGKTWTQEPTCGPSVPEPCLPAEVAHASFTSIAFAGSEAIVAYRILPNRLEKQYVGGLLVNDGAGWQIDQGAHEAMGTGAPWAVAGLPDGGAAFSASGTVYEREGPGAHWLATPTPFPGGGEPGGLTLFRENGALRVLATGEEPETYGVESQSEAPPGLPPVLIGPYPLSSDELSGVLRQTASGWADEEHELNNATNTPGDYKNYDMVYQPDPVSAALVNATGSEGWAVGGFVEPPPTHEGALDTADVERYRGGALAAPGTAESTVHVEGEHESESKWATFAIGGNAQCASPCGDRAEANIGPDVWLKAALKTAADPARIPGVRAFLYTGPRVVNRRELSGPLEAADTFSYEDELGRYAEVLDSTTLPTYAVASPTDLDYAESEHSYEQVFRGRLPSGFAEPECNTQGCQSAYYVVPATVSGRVSVIVLDNTTEVQPPQAALLTEQLEVAAKTGHPAIVVGNANLNAELAAGNRGAGEVARALVTPHACASAYFYDAPEENIQEPLQQYRCESKPIPTFGSGTLGYVDFQSEAGGAFLGDSGFLVAQVDFAKREEASNVAPVAVKLIPNIGELAIEAESGTLLRRSEEAQFSGLARRPRAGNRSEAGSPKPDTNLYVTLPSYCVGTLCATKIEPEYEFSSSEPKVGNFVEPNLAASPKGNVPLLEEPGEKPIADHHSGLFCSYNKGETTVTISAGGLEASLPVTVQAGSVRKPCETVPLEKPPAVQQSIPVPPPAPAPAPAPAAAAPTPAPLPVPPPPAAPVTPPPARAVPPLAASPFFAVQPLAAFVPPFVPPPVPTPARPTPPSGTSAVEAVEREEEEESATESVANQAVAYRAAEHEPTPLYLLGIVMLAAFAGASARRRPRRGRREVRVAPATISTMRAQRRMSRRP
jgi:hypothetical protein